MMTKAKTKKSALLKMVFIIPAAVVLTLLFSISITDRVIAQSDSDVKKVENAQEPVKKAQKDGDVFRVVEVMPKFPGGDEARIKYMVENIKYPEAARKNGITGTVFVQYVVEKDGSITGVKVLRGIGGGCDEEAMRVIENMPNWEPGLEKGKPVRTQFNMPISFKLDGKGEKESKNGEVKDPPPPPKSE
jgi:protein TonB